MNEREELLEAISDLKGVVYEYSSLEPILTYFKKHLTQLEPEPVGWWDEKLGFFKEKHFDQLQPLYLSPPKQEPVRKVVIGDSFMIDDTKYIKAREPLSGKEISHGFRADQDATNAESYWAGVEYAEKCHGIGEQK